MSNEMNVCGSIADLLFRLTVARLANRSIIVLGPPGSGKSEIIASLIKLGFNILPANVRTLVAEDFVPKVVTLFLSQVTGEDLVGIPWQNPAHLDNPEGFQFVPMLRLRSLVEGDILFIDEITAPAADSSETAMLQFMQGNRPCVGDWEGPEGVFRIAAGNRAHDANVNYSLNKVVGNRCAIVEFLGPDPETEWLPHFRTERNGHPAIQTCIMLDATLLSKYDPDRMLSPTPRSWVNASNELQQAEFYVGNINPNAQLSMDRRMNIVASNVGKEAALKLESIFHLQDKLIPWSRIVADPHNAPVPDRGSDPQALFLTVTHVGNRGNPAEWRQACAYIARMPIEMQGVALSQIVGRHPELVSTKEYQQFAISNQDLMV